MYIFTMAYSRIVLGAHYLSDVTVGFLIGYVAFIVTRYLYFDKSKTVISVLMQREAAATLDEASDPAEGSDALQKANEEETEEAEEEPDVAEEETDEGLLLYKDYHEIHDVVPEEPAPKPKEAEEEFEPDEEMIEQETDEGFLLYKTRKEIRATEETEAETEDEDYEEDEEEDEDEDY